MAATSGTERKMRTWRHLCVIQVEHIAKCGPTASMVSGVWYDLQGIALDEENFPALQSPARPKQSGFLAKTSPDKAAADLQERPRSPVSTLNQAPSATPSPAPTSAADLLSGNVTPVKAADSTCSETGTDSSMPHQATQAESCESEEPAAAAPTAQEAGPEAIAAHDAALEVQSADVEPQDDSAGPEKATQQETAAAAEEPASKAAEQNADAPAAQAETVSGMRFLCMSAERGLAARSGCCPQASSPHAYKPINLSHKSGVTSHA